MPEEPEAQKQPDGEKPVEKRSPNPERRFVQRQIVQPLIQWMPLGGSSWLFVGFLLKQEWAQVLLTFPITVVTAIWQPTAEISWSAWLRSMARRASKMLMR